MEKRKYRAPTGVRIPDRSARNCTDCANPPPPLYVIEVYLTMSAKDFRIASIRSVTNEHCVRPLPLRLCLQGMSVVTLRVQ
jgi:hypothetical protein